MKLEEALDVVAEALDTENYYSMEKRLLAAFKKRHNIGDLYFYGDSSWFYCSTKDPKKDYNIINHPNINHNIPYRDILWRLISLVNGNHGGVCYDRERFDNMDDLKRYHLTKKLAGIK